MSKAGHQASPANIRRLLSSEDADWLEVMAVIAEPDTKHRRAECRPETRLTTPRRFRPRDRRRHPLVSLLLRTSVGQRFDYSAKIGSIPVNPAVPGETRCAASPHVFAAVIVVVVVIGFVRHRPLLGVRGALGAGIAVLATDLLKNDVLNRPFLTRQVTRAAHTFPSDHTAAAMAWTMALVLVVPARWRSTMAILAGADGC